VVFNLDYRLAPETPAPGGILDCYAGLKFIIANAEKYGIDPKRVTFTGDSGGGYLSMGLGMELSKRGESGLVPFIIGSACMVGVGLITMTAEDYAKGYDDPHRMTLLTTSISQALAGVDGQTPYETIKDRADVFVTNMADDLLKNFPPTVLFTSEFDICRWGTEVMAQLLEKHSKLLDYIVHPGATHCWYFADHKNKSPSTQKCWDDYGKVFNRYLKGEITTALADLDCKKIVTWGSGWRFDKSDFPYELKGVMHPVLLDKRVATKKHFAKLMAGGPTGPPPDIHPALMVRASMDRILDYWISKISCN
jgi:acetyl esterase/lipase